MFDLTEAYDDFVRDKRRLTEKYQDKVREKVDREMFDRWKEIHEEIRRLHANGTPKSELRKKVRAYTNTDRWRYWWDSRPESPVRAEEAPIRQGSIDVRFPLNPNDGDICTYTAPTGQEVSFEFLETPALGSPRWELTRGSKRGEHADWISSNLEELTKNAQVG